MPEVSYILSWCSSNFIHKCMYLMYVIIFIKYSSGRVHDLYVKIAKDIPIMISEGVWLFFVREDFKLLEPDCDELAEWNINGKFVVSMFSIKYLHEVRVISTHRYVALPANLRTKKNEIKLLKPWNESDKMRTTYVTNTTQSLLKLDIFYVLYEPWLCMQVLFEKSHTSFSH